MWIPWDVAMVERGVCVGGGGGGECECVWVGDAFASMPICE